TPRVIFIAPHFVSPQTNANYSAKKQSHPCDELVFAVEETGYFHCAVKVLFLSHAGEGGNLFRSSSVAPEKKRQDAASTKFIILPATLSPLFRHSHAAPAFPNDWLWQ